KTGIVPDYQSGAMTNYMGSLSGGLYYPASGGSTSLATLINAGSRSAPAASLYHFTTQTNQTKEATSTVDIGFHYLSLNGANQAMDSDQDGLPDYVEDANGDGTFNSGETNWLDGSDGPLKVLITEPKSTSNIP